MVDMQMFCFSKKVWVSQATYLTWKIAHPKKCSRYIMLQHVLLFSICSYLVTMHIPQKRSNPGDDAKELGWCAYEPLESADIQDILDRPKKWKILPSVVFYSLWHATKTWKWSCVHPHTSILSIQCSKCLNPRSFPSLFPGEGWRHRHGADARLHLAHLQAVCRAALSLKTFPYDPQDHKMAKW